MTPQRKLILVKHASPEQVPSIDACEWHLSHKGRADCAPLAEMLRPAIPAALFCSVESKATETAQLIGATLGLTAKPVLGLHEHDRRNALYFHNAEDFETAIRQLFAQPDTQVYGNETAAAAATRFSRAIGRCIANSG